MADEPGNPAPGRFTNRAGVPGWLGFQFPEFEIGAQEEFDVLHARGEAVETLLFITEQRVSGDHDLALAVPAAAAYQVGAGEDGRRGTVARACLSVEGARPEISCVLVSAELVPAPADEQTHDAQPK
jgi:hypothetical protein